MKLGQTGKKRLGKLGGPRRKAVRMSQQELVKESFLTEGSTLPLVIEPAVQGVELTTWAQSNREDLRKKLAQYGGILFRGFQVNTAEDFEGFIPAVSEESLEYRERSSPRHAVHGNIYTSTDYPAEHPIFLHNENSYQNTWPMNIFFYCHIAAEEGGETPIADCRKIYQKIDPEIRQRFADKKWMYMRNFGDGFGLPWPTVFQTTDREEVEAYCGKTGIKVEWKEGDGLRTRAVRPAISKHPKTGEMVWFNHATFFHVTTREKETRESLLAEFAEEDLPTHTYYGDGSPIEEDVLDHLRGIYHEETVKFPWHKGDVLMLDNMLVAHGREPFKGSRKVLAGMSEPWSWDRF